MIQTKENGEKPHFGPDFWAQWSEIRTAKFLKKIWLRQSLDIMVSYHHGKYQEKLKIQTWENLVKDRQTDGRTDESEFIGCCRTGLKRRIERN